MKMRVKKGAYAVVKIDKNYVVKEPLSSDNDQIMSIVREKFILDYLKDCKHVIKMIKHEDFKLYLEKGKCISSQKDVMKGNKYIMTKYNLLIDKDDFREQAIAAVKEIHSKGIVHGDIKFNNFVIVDGVLKLIDFGCSYPMTKADYPDPLQEETDYQRLNMCFRYVGIKVVGIPRKVPFKPPHFELPEVVQKVDKEMFEIFPIDQAVRVQQFDAELCLEALLLFYQTSVNLSHYMNVDRLKKLINSDAPFIFPSYHYSDEELAKYLE